MRTAPGTETDRDSGRINFRRGAGEFLAFAIIAPLLCFLVVELCGYLQYVSSMHDITDALDVAGRTASLCYSKDDAVAQAQSVVDNALVGSRIKSATVSIEYTDPTETEWKSGVIFVVTIDAEVDYAGMVFTPSPNSTLIEGAYSRSMVYTVEGSTNQALRQRMVDYAHLFIGGPYVWGASGLNPGEPMDCGQFVCAVYYHFNMDITGNRFTITESYGRRVDSISAAQPGDVLHYPHHVALYIGNNELIEAASPVLGIRKTRVYPGYDRIVNIIDYWN